MTLLWASGILLGLAVALKVAQASALKRLGVFWRTIIAIVAFFLAMFAWHGLLEFLAAILRSAP